MTHQTSVKKEFIDQSAHMIGAAIIVSPFIAAPSVLTAALAGFGIGLVREVSTRGPTVKLEYFKSALTSRWSFMDMSFWAIGAAAAYLILT